MPERILTHTKDLEDFCKLCQDSPYITVDTEFVREKTYFPHLCLIQIGKPKTEKSDKMAVAIDPLSEDMNLACLKDLFFHPDIVKVFHAARQDLEIMLQLFDGSVPTPFFDTQIAAMVTGYGDQVGYQSLVKQICNVELDKTNQYTDWSKRPLTKSQVDYAIADVTYLCEIYETLKSILEKESRSTWVQEELEHLCDPAVIQIEPDQAWQRIKTRLDKPKILVVLKALAAWREHEAVTLDRPRHFIIKDEAIVELARQAPKNEKALTDIRGLPEKYKKGERSKGLLKIVKDALASPKSSWPKKPRKKSFPQELMPAVEMLKMLLKIQAIEHGLVPRLIANQDDLEDFLLDKDNPKIMQGWRKEIFGDVAQLMIDGQIALRLKDQKIIQQNV